MPKKKNLPVPAYPGAGGTLMVGGKAVKLARAVTVPQLKQVENQRVAVTIIGPIRQSTKVIKRADDKKKKSEDVPTAAPHICRVRDLEDEGREKEYICGSVVRSNLDENYPDESYVGKSFVIEMGPKMPGRRWRQYMIAEINV